MKTFVMRIINEEIYRLFILDRSVWINYFSRHFLQYNSPYFATLRSYNFIHIMQENRRSYIIQQTRYKNKWRSSSSVKCLSRDGGVINCTKLFSKSLSAAPSFRNQRVYIIIKMYKLLIRKRVFSFNIFQYLNKIGLKTNFFIVFL